ncbi:uncharacterized protein LOC111063426 [Nilaparvata lugens]|uniref:uncharacterized protein LOC111063426 n=1 Tax=Nilaparvata lugens TaxID=108931 RepID=UPI000B988002|nr:uncharacterized protein LOC111063426 [Nilaparvata lugens]
MDDDMKICCVKLSLAARVIAMVGLITSVLILTQLSTELADPESSGGSVSILLGLDVEEFKYTIGGDDRQRKTDATEIMIAFLLFSFFYAVSSAILIWGTIVEQSWCALPWLICVAFSFATQVATLAIHAIALGTRKNKLIIAISVLNIGLTVYFWIVVFCAQRTWRRQHEEEKQLQRSRTVQASPAPPLPNKYMQV